MDFRDVAHNFYHSILTVSLPFLLSFFIRGDPILSCYATNRRFGKQIN